MTYLYSFKNKLTNFEFCLIEKTIKSREIFTHPEADNPDTCVFFTYYLLLHSRDS